MDEEDPISAYKPSWQTQPPPEPFVDRLPEFANPQGDGEPDEIWLDTQTQPSS